MQENWAGDQDGSETGGASADQILFTLYPCNSYGINNTSMVCHFYISEEQQTEGENWAILAGNQ